MTHTTERTIGFQKILFVSTGILCAVLAYAGYRVWKVLTTGNRLAVVLGVVSHTPITPDDVVSSPSGNLKYFFESRPSTVQEDTASWLAAPVMYTINADTLNERDVSVIPKPAGTYRILAFGDSFTFGHYVNTRDNWTEKLEDLVNAHCLNGDTTHIDVVNFGERGYDVRYAEHRFALRGPKYTPDLILYLESDTGFSRIAELDIPLLTQIEKEISPNGQPDESQNKRIWQELSRRMQTLYPQHVIEEKIGNAWRDFLTEKGTTPFVLMSFSYSTDREKELLRQWANGMPGVQVYTGIPDIYRRDGTFPDGHPNIAGHAMIARDVYTYLSSHHILTCTE